MRPTYAVRSRWSRVVAVLGWMACAALGVAFVVEGGPGLAGRLAWTALAALVLWALWWRPCVRVSDGGIDVDDVLRDTHVPWPAVEGLDSRWSLAVRTPEGRVSSWAVPTGSPTGLGARVRGALGRRSGPPPTEDPGAALEDDGRVATVRVRGSATTVVEIAEARRAALREAGHLRDDGPVPPVVHRWHVATGAVALALAAAGLLLG